MSCRRLFSRCGVPTAPRKYFVVTMLVALMLHSAGNSTPRCSKLTEPSRQFVMTTSRRSHVTASYGCTPGVVQTRSIGSPRCRRLLRWVGLAGVPLTVSVMGVLSDIYNARRAAIRPRLGGVLLGGGPAGNPWCGGAPPGSGASRLVRRRPRGLEAAQGAAVTGTFTGGGAGSWAPAKRSTCDASPSWSYGGSWRAGRDGDPAVGRPWAWAARSSSISASKSASEENER